MKLITNLHLFIFFKDCDLQYLKEPPSALFDCNPYSNSARLMLECQIQVPASVGSRVEILWFFRNTSQATLHLTGTSFPPLQDVRNLAILDGDVWRISSSVTLRHLISPRHQGIYFCQIALDGNIAFLSPSNALVVANEEDGRTDYLNSHPCYQLTVQETLKCAGNISDVFSSTTSVTGGETPGEPTWPATSLHPDHSSSSLPSVSDLSTFLPPDLPAPSGSTGVTQKESNQGPTQNQWVYYTIAVLLGLMIVVLIIFCVGLCFIKYKIKKLLGGELVCIFCAF